MKTLIFILMLLLIPFSVKAKDWKPRECCDVCRWDAQLKRVKCDFICPCPDNKRPTPALEFDNDIRLAGTWYQRQNYKPPILSRGFVAMGIIPVNERDIGLMLLLVALFLGLFALLVDTFVGLRFWRWRR